jgi:hypothetical protein
MQSGGMLIRSSVLCFAFVCAYHCYSYNARVAILLPTAGERLDVFMLALLGCVSQRIWACGKRTKVSLELHATEHGLHF